MTHIAKPKRRRDTNKLAKLIDTSTGEGQEQDPYSGKNRAAVDLGRKGGKARAAKLTKAQLSEIGRRGAAARTAKRHLAVPSTSRASGSPPKRQKKKSRAVIPVPED